MADRPPIVRLLAQNQKQVHPDVIAALASEWRVQGVSHGESGYVTLTVVAQFLPHEAFGIYQWVQRGETAPQSAPPSPARAILDKTMELGQEVEELGFSRQARARVTARVILKQAADAIRKHRQQRGSRAEDAATYLELLSNDVEMLRD